MKGFMKKIRTAVVLFVVVALMAPLFMGQRADAASMKKYTVGAFKLSAPKSWESASQTIAGNDQLTFQNGMYVLLVQSTYVGRDMNTDLLKSALKLGFDSIPNVEVKNAKYSNAKIKLGEAVKFTGKFDANGMTMKCRGYAVSKDGYMMLVLAMGNQDKNEKKVINSIQLK